MTPPVDQLIVDEIARILQLVRTEAGYSTDAGETVITEPANDEIEPTGAGAAYVEGTDYLVNRRVGMIFATTGGAIVDGNVKVSYDGLASTGSLINGGTRPVIKARVRLDGKNLVTGLPILIDIDEFNGAPTKEVDFLSDNFVPLTLDGQMRLLDGKIAPYTVKLLDA